jgi:hypothetical protein
VAGNDSAFKKDAVQMLSKYRTAARGSVQGRQEERDDLVSKEAWVLMKPRCEPALPIRLVHR